MRYTMAGVALVLSLGLLTAAPSFTQTRGTVANVYVQSKVGVYVYNANTSGQLTLVKGSAFADTGQMEAVRGQVLLISVGTNYLHAYRVGVNSNNQSGAVGPQLGQIDTASYAGANCGSTSGAAILDHTGQYFSVQLWGATDSSGNTICSAWQTYKLNEDGGFTFLGDAVNTTLGYRSPAAIPLYTVSSNDLFTYGIYSDPYASSFEVYRRASAGDLVQDFSFSEVDPTPNPSVESSNYYPFSIAADPASHLAVIMDTPFAGSNVFQLASYTINNNTGAIQSTNTWANMPAVQPFPSAMAMSWSGAYVAVSGLKGVQVFHFNGAAPATVLATVLPSVEIDQVAWDKSNHLYAISYDSGNPAATSDLYVFNVTSTGIAQAPGSPYKVSGTGIDGSDLVGLVVVPIKS